MASSSPRTASVSPVDVFGATGAGSGTVTSVDAALPTSTFSASSGAVTTSGTLTFTFVNQTANKVLAGPTSGGAAAPAWRILVAADIPDISATYQPRDSDLDAIAALSTTAYGRALLILANQAALQSAVGVSTMGLSGALTDGTGTLAVGHGGTGQTALSAVTVGKATTLETARTINGTSFDGSANVVVGAIPQNSQSAAYTTVLGDAGKHILHPAADTTARTFTIDSNANVAYPVGTTITFVNQHGAGIVTIAITSDTMRLAGAGTTGSRTLAADGIATALKITSTEWIISGAGLT